MDTNSMSPTASGDSLREKGDAEKMIKPVEWTFLTAESACETLERVGITLNPSSIRNCEVSEYGIMYYETKADGTAWEIDLNDLKRRHKGLDRGCFWTEWQ